MKVAVERVIRVGKELRFAPIAALGHMVRKL